MFVLKVVPHAADVFSAGLTENFSIWHVFLVRSYLITILSVVVVNSKGAVGLLHAESVRNAATMTASDALRAINGNVTAKLLVGMTIGSASGQPGLCVFVRQGSFEVVAYRPAGGQFAVLVQDITRRKIAWAAIEPMARGLSSAW